MATYIVRRLVTSILTLFGALTVIFLLTHIVPADPVRMVVGIDADQQTVERFRREAGLDQPLWVQYFIYVNQLAHGDLGRSLTSRQPVSSDLEQYYPATLELALVTGVVYIGLGLAFGSLAGMTRSRPLDRTIRFLSLGTYSLPPFWLGLVLQVVFYGQLHALPAIGRLDPNLTPPPRVTGLYLIDTVVAGSFVGFASAAQHLALPVTTLVLGQAGLLVRMLRVSILDVRERAYVTSARAKGLRESSVFRAHVLRNALLPVITMAGIQLAWLLTGTVVVESIFGWPGMGRYAVTSILSVDYSPVMAVALVTTVVFLIINLFIDCLYAVVDPRIRYGR
jgi:peptide/nickel transport system permease protein